MLVLTRKQTERLVIAENIELVVLDICGKRVRLGIQAPEYIAVDRWEVHAAKQVAQANATRQVG